jgi:DNA repair protein RadA
LREVATMSDGATTTVPETEADLTELPGVGPATSDKLKDAGYEDFMSIAVASPSELTDQADVGDSVATNVIQAARDHADVGGFETGRELAEKRDNVSRLTTAADTFDDLMNGGFETRSITEVYGEFGSGKTQVVLQLATTVQLPEEEGGLDADAIFIDTENTFRPERIRGMAEGLGLDPEEALERIHVARAYNSHHQMLLMDKAQELAQEHDIGLLVVDSLTAHYRAEYVGRGNLAERQQKLNKFMHSILRFADLNNCVVAVTNQVQHKPDAFFGDPTRPIGGNIVGHTATYRIYLRKSKGEKRIARLIDSPCLPEGEAVVNITEDGIRE